MSTAIKPPPTLEADECDKLLAELLDCETTTDKNQKSIRNHCMALLMLDAGLRVGELVKLRIDDLYFGGTPVRTIFIKKNQTKNKVAHSIPVSTRLTKSLVTYYNSQPLIREYVGGRFAFTGRRGVGPLSTRQVERIINAAGMAAFGRPLNPHVLRHTAASKWMRVTNQRTVQQLLGHKYSSSTQIYCHPNSDDLRKAIDKAGEQLSGLGSDLEDLAGYQATSPSSDQPGE